MKTGLSRISTAADVETHPAHLEMMRRPCSLMAPPWMSADPPVIQAV